MTDGEADITGIAKDREQAFRDTKPDGRDETDVERADRQLSELLQELRVVQTGVQVLFAFLLGVPFTQRFTALGDGDRALYFATLLLSGLAIILLLAPTAWHRWLFELGDKRHVVDVAHRLSVAGLACVGLAVVCVVALIADLLYPGTTAVASTVAMFVIATVLWAILPARRRMDLRRR
jgi:hypothetical protein